MADSSPVHVRPRRAVRPPMWLQDYEVRIPPQTATTVTEQTSMQPEGWAEMTPLRLHAPQDPRHQQSYDETSQYYSDAPTVNENTLTSYQSPLAMMMAIHQLQEENRCLHEIARGMRHQQDSSAMPSLRRHPTHPRHRHQAWTPPPPTQMQGPGQPQPIAVEPRHSESLPPLPPMGVEDQEGWPLPPPPIMFTDDAPAPLPAPNAQSEPKLEFLEELGERLRRLETYLSPRCSLPYYDDPVEEDRDLAYHSPNQQEFRYESWPPVNQRRNATHYQEKAYRGPKPSIPKFTRDDPREFARLRIALENILPADATERFKYQILCDHLKFEEALLIADSYVNSTHPYTDTMVSLTKQYGQPHQLSLRRISELMDEPPIQSGDITGFRKFALRVRALVGMLKQLGEEGRIELKCGSHVARLMKKLPQDLRAVFRRYLCGRQDGVPSLLDFSHWLEQELLIQEAGDNRDGKEGAEYKDRRLQRDHSRRGKPSRAITVLHGATPASTPETQTGNTSYTPALEVRNKPYCSYCCNNQHLLDQCANFKQLTRDQKVMWVKSNNRCWRCGRQHMAAQCKLKQHCKICRGKHLESLHDVNDRSITSGKDACPTLPVGRDQPTDVLYLDRRAGCNRVLLKISKVLLRSGNHSLETYAILDDGSERTILLPEAAQCLKLQGQSESLTLRTIRHDERTLQGSSVTFTISPVSNPAKTFTVDKVFTAEQLSLAEHSYPVDSLKKKFKHLRSLPIQPFSNAKPLLLIGSDYPHLITPIMPVCLGPPGSPAAVKTRLGWTLQGPSPTDQSNSQQCLHLSTCTPMTELYSQVEKLWQVDILPYRNEKLVTRSRRDQEAVELLEAKTQRVEVNGVHRYATPLLRVRSMPTLRAPPQAVLPHLRAIERRLLRDQVKAEAYSAEIRKLVEAGYIRKINPEAEARSTESWFIPHHLVTHNGKNRIVFNCSFDHENQNLNKLLLPGPNLGPSILGVLLRFREHSVAISSDIKGMFHQVRLLIEDRPLLRFLWRDLQRDSKPDTYEWQVLPFGTTCSPCCAIYALQRHIRDHGHQGEDVRHAVEAHFYVDNWLQSFSTADEAKNMVNQTRALLNEAGFELRQWASNQPQVINHLPKDLRSESSEQWLNHSEVEPQEPALGLSWMCHTDTLSYKSRLHRSSPTTMRSIYRVLASQYDPLGFLIPYTTRAKIIVQQLWDKGREWDDPLLPVNLLNAWQDWEDELQHIDSISLPRCYVSSEMDHADTRRTVHIFCDASECAYGSVAYLRTEDTQGRVEVAFLTARSRVAPKRQLSMPRLELCAAVTGAQLVKLLQRELVETVHEVTMWTDATTVLSWIRSDSCHFKVFVGTRIAEIQELTDIQAWRYVPSAENPADDLTRGKTLKEIAGKSRWACGPSFLTSQPEQWPVEVSSSSSEIGDELRKSAICMLTTSTAGPDIPNVQQYSTFTDLVAETARCLHGAAPEAKGSPTAEHYKQAELKLLGVVQLESFPEEVQCLKTGKALPTSSRLLNLAPEFDQSLQLIRVGGRLRHCDKMEVDAVQPVLLDPKHPITKLLIQQTDRELKHPGAERLFAELRRKYWILRGREAVKKEQHSCAECQRWRAQPIVPKMSDLPSARVRVYQPAFYSTGIDCFGPFQVKSGRRTEKCWGLLFKCLTTRAVHIEVLSSLNTDSFLLALRRFISRRGKPMELLSDQGTNFKGGQRELMEAFQALHPSLKSLLAAQQIQFSFNPPCAPHFGGAWEREIKSVKSALNASLGSQAVTPEVLRTTLIEIEGILNSKPVGYVSSDVADPDPVTPNLLLMGRLDPSLPQVLYHDSEIRGRRPWRVCQVLADRFWTQFLRHYLPTLQTRSKWQIDNPPIQLDTVVMVVDPQLPRALWPVGRIVRVLPGADGLIRTAEVRVKERSYIRPVSRLIRLPSVPEDNQSVVTANLPDKFGGGCHKE